MRNDALKQFAKLRQQLWDEKTQLESRLQEINQVLGTETAAPEAAPVPSSAEISAGSARGARRRGRGANSMSLREAVIEALSHGPVARKDLVRAVEGVGYKFATRNPLNSIGSVLYGKNSRVKNKQGKFYVEGSGKAPANGAEPETPPRRKRKRTMSPEARARISEAQRARWAKQKSGQ